MHAYVLLFLHTVPTISLYLSLQSEEVEALISVSLHFMNHDLVLNVRGFIETQQLSGHMLPSCTRLVQNLFFALVEPFLTQNTICILIARMVTNSDRMEACKRSGNKGQNHE
jgi:hypothetical protein